MIRGGRRIDWSRLEPAAVARHLADPRPVVRDRAMRELVDRRQTAWLAKALAGASIPVKQRVAWVLASLPGDASLEALRRLVTDTKPRVVRVAARALGVRRDARASTDLARLLTRSDRPVRFAATEALSHAGTKDAPPHLLAALEAEPDRFLEHALVHAVYRLASVEDLAGALSHDHPRVQKAALLLLDPVAIPTSGFCSSSARTPTARRIASSPPSASR